jgi:AraC-like DNA-binding protein
MRLLMSERPRPELRNFVRAYAQRVMDAGDLSSVQFVPAELEPILNFELGAMPGVRYRGVFNAQHRVWLGGAQTEFSGILELHPGVESFAVFFQPAGWALLFNQPVRELTNVMGDGTALAGSGMHHLWNQLGEVSEFSARVQLVEDYLMPRALTAISPNRFTMACTQIFRNRGNTPIAALARAHSLSVRQFQRSFEREIGVSPKLFARVARFQSALDAKLRAPDRSWLQIAHSLNYHDQMHMIHDFHKLGRAAPSELISLMGDVRPPALRSYKNDE